MARVKPCLYAIGVMFARKSSDRHDIIVCSCDVAQLIFDFPEHENVKYVAGERYAAGMPQVSKQGIRAR
eukprot:6206104-Pleurochrysis_carterae.AAC.2